MSNPDNIMVEAFDDENACVGAIYGYCVEIRLPHWINHLEKHVKSLSTIEDLKKVLESANLEGVAILSDLYVSEDSRGEGHGDYLVNQFLEKVSYPFVILFADKSNEQQEGFNLLEFFSQFGFEQYSDCGDVVLMVLDSLDLLNTTSI